MLGVYRGLLIKVHLRSDRLYERENDMVNNTEKILISLLDSISAMKEVQSIGISGGKAFDVGYLLGIVDKNRDATYL